MTQNPILDRRKKADEIELSHRLTEISNEGFTVTVVDSKKKDTIKNTFAEIKNELNPKGIMSAQLAVDVAHIKLSGESQMEIKYNATMTLLIEHNFLSPNCMQSNKLIVSCRLKI